MHTFTTERLLIRPLAEQDKALYCSLYTDTKIMRNISSPLCQEQAEKAFNLTLKAMEKSQPKLMTWAIVSKEKQQVVGIQALSWKKANAHDKNSKIPNEPEIGIILSREVNGKLYPEEAMGALMEYSYNYLSVKIINAFYAKKNRATHRFVQKLGFIYNKFDQPEDENITYQSLPQEMWQKKIICKIYQ